MTRMRRRPEPARADDLPRERWARLRTVLLRSVTVLLAVSMLYTAVTLGPILAAPGTDPVPARVAEWMRSNGMGWVVTELEKVAYQATKPSEGGDVSGGIGTVAPIAVPGGDGAKPGSAKKAASASELPLPNVVPPASPALPNEGVWQNLILNGSGQPAAKVVTVRPDVVHTSFTASIVWMDPRRMSFTLHPGTQVPGTLVDGQYTGSTSLTSAALASTVASFNSGFMFKDADGGYWQDGKAVVPLVQGAASMVFGTDGSLSVQVWHGSQPGPGVQAVRQNLSLLISNGTVSPAVHDPTTAVWGKTVGNYAFVWRTGIGVRADGSIVFVIGPTLSIVTLTDLLQRAGAVNAMELDINKDWTSYLTYRGGSPTKLTPDEAPSGQRYLTSSTRDFVACSVRA